MSSIIKSDISVNEVDMVEEEGVYTSLERKFLVSISTTYPDSRRLMEGMEAAGLPSKGSYAPGNTNLRCSKRQIQMAPDCNEKAIVTCSYTTIPQSKSNFIFSGGTTLGHTVTQNDIYGNQVTCSHTYPSDDSNYPSETRIQGADISVLMPSTTLTATGTLPVYYPDSVSRYWVGSMNSTYWVGNQPHYWMCTACDFEGTALGFGQSHEWRFTFQFEYRFTGWDIVTYYRDDTTGLPPANLVYGTGIKNVDWYGEIDFNYLFPGTN